MSAILMPYNNNGFYNVLQVNLNTANNGTEYRFFTDSYGNQANFVGYIRILRADDVCSIALGNPQNDRIPCVAGAWFTIPFMAGVQSIFVYNPASTNSNALLQVLVTV